jgi:hypothetical protein
MEGRVQFRQGGVVSRSRGTESEAEVRVCRQKSDSLFSRGGRIRKIGFVREGEMIVQMDVQGDG